MKVFFNKIGLKVVIAFLVLLAINFIAAKMAYALGFDPRQTLYTF